MGASDPWKCTNDLLTLKHSYNPVETSFHVIGYVLFDMKLKSFKKISVTVPPKIFGQF